MRSTPIRWSTIVAAALLATMAIETGVSARQIPQAPAQPRRAPLQIARIRHAGDENIPLAIPNLTKSLREKFKFDVAISHKELFPRDPNLIHYPLIYLTGQGVAAFDDELDRTALRRHLTPGGGTLFADSSGGNPTFDVSFRKFIGELLPNNPLVPIPRGDDLYNKRLGYNLANARRTAAAGGKANFPDLEGVKIDGHWAVIYSRLDVGSALENQADIAEKGYTHDSSLQIFSNVVLEANMP